MLNQVILSFVFNLVTLYKARSVSLSIRSAPLPLSLYQSLGLSLALEGHYRFYLHHPEPCLSFSCGLN